MEKLLEIAQALGSFGTELLVALVAISAFSLVGLSLYVVLQLVKSIKEGGQQ